MRGLRSHGKETRHGELLTGGYGGLVCVCVCVCVCGGGGGRKMGRTADEWGLIKGVVVEEICTE